MNYILFTTTRCPKCPAFKEFVGKFVKINGKILDEQNPSFEELSQKFEVTSVPRLFIFEDETFQKTLLDTSEVSDIYNFTQAHP